MNDFSCFCVDLCKVFQQGRRVCILNSYVEGGVKDYIIKVLQIVLRIFLGLSFLLKFLYMELVWGYNQDNLDLDVIFIESSRWVNVGQDDIFQLNCLERIIQVIIFILVIIMIFKFLQ